MARFLREVPVEVAQQALINKTINASALDAVKDDPEPDVDPDDLEILARDVPAPELVPYEYAYVDLYKGGDAFYIAINPTFYRRSKAKRLNPSG